MAIYTFDASMVTVGFQPSMDRLEHCRLLLFFIFFTSLPELFNKQAL